jgi:bifunctional non-homologous end joining protein LigD
MPGSEASRHASQEKPASVTATTVSKAKRNSSRASSTSNVKSLQPPAASATKVKQVIANATATSNQKQVSVRSSSTRVKVPDFIAPMLATLTDHPFDDKDWLYEIKWDGYRAVAEVSGKNVKLYSRNGISFLPLYPQLAKSLAKLNIKAVIDGEIVVLDRNGRSDFQNLQQFDNADGSSLVYLVFDCLRINGKDITATPLLERKKLLKELLPSGLSDIRYSDHIIEKGTSFFEAASKKNLEGIIAKKSDSLYDVGRRSKEWLKIKHQNTEEVVIAGYTAPQGSRRFFGALILAVKAKKGWQYIGHTGTGFTEKILKEVYSKLQPYIRDTSPFENKVKVNALVTWIEPVLVCNVKFTERTRDGMLRHPVFQGLRIDKTAQETGGKGH